MENNTEFDLISLHKDQINYFFDHFDSTQLLSFCQKLDNFNENIYIIGIGKSNNIAKQFSNMLNAISYKAFTLSCQDLLHGDIGVINSNNIVILISKSGNTSEIKTVYPFLNDRKCQIITITCNSKCFLTEGDGLNIILPKCKELDLGYDLYPSTSLVYYTVFCNLVCYLLMKNKKFTQQQYAKNHPSGSIGLKIYKKVSNIMIPNDESFICSKKTTIKDAVKKLNNERSSCLIVTDDNNNVKGIFSDYDLRNFILSNNEIDLNQSIEKIMTINPFSISISMSLADLIEYVKKNNLKYLSGIPVVDNDNKLLGIVILRRLVKYL